jgi:hypothetical protein
LRAARAARTRRCSSLIAVQSGPSEYEVFSIYLS